MEVEQIEIRDHLQRHTPFNAVPEERLSEVACQVEIAYFRAGDQIISFGDEIRHLHYIRSGSVELYRRSGELYNRLGEGDIFGQLSLMTGKPARFPVRALEDTLIYFIPHSMFRKLFDEVDDFADFVEVEDRTRLRQATSSELSSNQLMTTRIAPLLRRKPVMIGDEATVRDAARLMTREGVSSVLIVAGDGEVSPQDASFETSPPELIGITTDSDLRKRLISEALPYDTPIREVMSSEPVTVQDDQFLFEALLIMLRENVHRLPVLRRLKPVGVIALSDIISHETQNSLFVARNIFHKQSLAELRTLVPDVKSCFVRMVNEDANSHMIGSAMATIGRSFKQRLLEIGERELGAPPVPYCFLALGSMARGEQFLVTDQDNAMVIDDEFDPERHDGYFRELAAFVSDGLNDLGYPYCTGDVMATNDNWRQPLSVWRDYFSDWIENPSARKLLNSSIFFDLDGVHGDMRLADTLKEQIATQASRVQSFLGCLAQNAQKRTPPLGFFRDFVLETSGRHQDSINLKRRGTGPLVDVIRVHALASGSRSQNSFKRLEDTVSAGYLTANMAADLRDALEFISIVRVRHQAFDVEAGREPNNNINPESLSAFERRSLKDAFKVLSNAQKFIKFRYRPVRTRQG